MEKQQTAAEKLKHRMERLKNLHLKRNEARTENHQHVIAEDERKKLPANWESRQRQAEWLISDEKARKEAQLKGLDYERVKLLNVSAIEAANLEKKKRKKNPDIGFSDYEAQTARQYNRLVKQMPPPNMKKYEEKKQEYGIEAFYGNTNAIIHGLHKDTPTAIENMVKDVENQISKRKSFSRRRTHNDDADIDYINEKNARFNKKLERYYGEHTTEIKQNLERGTAI